MEKMSLRIGTKKKLSAYIATQLNNLFPDEGYLVDYEAIISSVRPALERMRPVLNAVTCFEPNYFNHLHSNQYLIFLYFMASEVYSECKDSAIPDRLYLLNRALNSLDLYYKVKMPDIFFIAHSLGTVLVNTFYGAGFVAFHNVTVGRVGQEIPIIGKNVIIYPGGKVLGSSVIGDGVIVSAGAVISNQVIPANCIVFQGKGSLVIKERSKNYHNLYYRYQF